jgi:aspartyl protease family protein
MTRNAPAWIGIAALVAAACYFAALHALGDTRPEFASAHARLSSGVGFLIVIMGAAMAGLRGQVSLVLRQAVTWLSVMLAAVVIYAYRADFYQIGGPLLAELFQIPAAGGGDAGVSDPSPRGSSASSDFGQAVISAGRGGQFFVEAMVEGSHVELIADTGATLVALTAEDAQRIGIDHRDLDFRYRHKTANGIARAAHVVLGEVSIGPITVRDVHASVSEPGLLHMSLLGMSFLSRLSSFHIRGDQLVLER